MLLNSFLNFHVYGAALDNVCFNDFHLQVILIPYLKKTMTPEDPKLF